MRGKKDASTNHPFSDNFPFSQQPMQTAPKKAPLYVRWMVQLWCSFLQEKKKATKEKEEKGRRAKRSERKDGERGLKEDIEREREKSERQKNKSREKGSAKERTNREGQIQGSSILRGTQTQMRQTNKTEEGRE
jgi:hypothetical protein